jgi:acyl dehydratase
MPGRPPSGAYYFDDLRVGQVFVSAGRTITEADVVGFAGLSGDFNPIHTDTHFAAQGAYGQRVVYGVLGLSVATGLLDRLGVFSGTAIAMLGISTWTFTAPIFIGDTVHLELEIVDLRPSSSRPDRGIVGRHFRLFNQAGTLCQDGRIDLMVRRQPPSS